MAEEERNGYLLLEIACALDARDPWRGDTRHVRAPLSARSRHNTCYRPVSKRKRSGAASACPVLSDFQ